MKELLKKEISLVLHPTNWLFLALSALVLVPNYPYYVTFFYTGLGIFFLCLSGRENKDLEYTVALPVEKRDVVRARILVALLLEAAQMLLVGLFVAVSQSALKQKNLVGMDANLSLLGLSLPMLGLFNAVFFGLYFKNLVKVGKAFGIASIAIAAYMVAAETCAHALPFVRDVLDTPDPQHLTAKLVTLFLGLAAFVALTVITLKKSEKNFEKQDL
ncbi:MAG: ABC-2 transporter permease [Christensenellaceae bacterium]|jgi:hypothetical protein|nr:hypothetical protein [Clostridia bacterium]PWM01927.1 MAG: hypothetical protein DBY05_03535 [Clostridiales bacterium]